MMIKKLLIILILFGLTGCSQQVNVGAELPVLSTSEKISIDGIEKVLKDKTQKEKIEIKSKELAKVKIDKYTKDDLEIEIIGDIEEIDGGIQIFAKAWKDGKQLGFGKDGTVEIERFRFFNPPVLVDDENGDIIQEIEEENPATREITIKQRKLKYDPKEAIIQSLTHTLSLVAKKGDKIVTGKIGNTTSTFYSGAGDGHVLNYSVGQPSQSNWDTTYDATSGSTAQPTITTFRARIDILGIANEIDIWRTFLPFDTSALPNGDTISSATLSVYPTEILDAYNGDGYDYIALVETAQDGTDTLITADYDTCGDAINNPTKGSADIDISGLSTGSYQNISLNSTGIGWISDTGVTKLGMREGHDIEDNFPGDPGENNKYSSLKAYTSEQDGAGTTSDPKLVVEHSTPVSRRIINIE